MTVPYGYDFADHQVRELVVGSHVPCEQVVTSAEGTVIRPLICEKCHANWPCPVIIGVREYYNTHNGMTEKATSLGPDGGTAE